MALNARKRSLIAKIRDEYKNYVVEESNLRSELVITNTTPQYAFSILQGDKQASVVERLLNKNDLFIALSIGLFMYERLDASPGITELQTYPNVNAFTAGTGFAVRNLNVFYNGLLSLQIGTVFQNSGWDTKRFKYVPQTQQSSATNYSQTDENVGFIDLEPLIKLSGANDNKFVASLPYGPTPAVQGVTSGSTNMYVLYIKGLLVKGAAQAALRVK